jgi:uncharacterized membrane protein
VGAGLDDGLRALLRHRRLPTFAVILRAIFSFEQPTFAVVYLGIAGLFGALAFLISVIALPMILDREVDAVCATLASMAAYARNPTAMLVWAGCIVSLIIGYVGLKIVMP